MKLKFLFLMLVPAFVLASEGTGGETDIIPRTINFLIFAAILYYLIAEPAKNFFTGRKDQIADKLNSIQKRLKESKAKKEQALQKVEDAKANAASLIQTAKKEAEMIKERLAEDLKIEIESMIKAHNERVEIERRKMIRDTVAQVLDEIFEDGAVAFEKDDFVDIVMKKVA